MNRIFKKIFLGIATIALLLAPGLGSLNSAVAQNVNPLPGVRSGTWWDWRDNNWWARQRSILLFRTESGRIIHPSRIILKDERSGNRLVLRNRRDFSSRLTVEVKVGHRAFIDARRILARRNAVVLVDARRDLLSVGGVAFRILDLDIIRRW